MKKFTKFVSESIEIQDDTLNFISASDLKKYLTVANKFLSDEAKEVINYLIDHNADYVTELGNTNSENALADFMDRKSPRNEEEKKLIKALVAINKKGNLLEVPVFQTAEQFNGIISGKISPDEVIIDLVSEEGRNEVVRKYSSLLYKIVNQYVGKSNLDPDELYSAALLGLTYAMNAYGKKSDKTKAEDEKITQYTFSQYAAQWMRIVIIEDIRNNSRTVRIPISAQNKEKDETGSIARSNTISGDNKFSDDENAKSLFDIINDYTADNADKRLNKEDIQKLWKVIYKAIDDKFDTKMKDIFYSYYGVHGYKKLKNKEIADKYNVTPQNIAYYCSKINKFLMADKAIWNKLKNLYELYKECLHDEEYDGTHEPYIYSRKNINEEAFGFIDNTFEVDNDPDNMLWKFSTWFNENNSRLLIDILLKSILEMDEIKCRQSIKDMITNEDALSQEYFGVIKNFVNFMYDIVEENQTIDYADKVVRIAKIIGKERLEALSNYMSESKLEEDAKKLESYMNSNDEDKKPVKILFIYYCNHFENIEKDAAEIEGSKEIKEQVYKVYNDVFGEDPLNTVSGLTTICKTILDKKISY